MQNLKLFITGHKGFETLLFHELRELIDPALAKPEKKYGGVEIHGNLEVVYRICLHSRLANRVFCELGRAQVEDENQLYQAVFQVDWGMHFDAHASIAVAATLSRSRLEHSHFVALRTKDAIVDQFRERYGSRPIVEKKQPDIQIHINIHHNQATISLDLSGESLHRRGYRLQHSGAPLKEHLAAALLIQAGWGQPDSPAERLVDPMCGSGTFAIEAAMMTANIAPGLQRQYFGFNQWRLHQPGIWETCVEQARRNISASSAVVVYASDHDAAALEIARENAKRAQVEQLIDFSHQQISELKVPSIDGESLVMCNPPWGKRLQAEQNLGQLYSDLGAAVQQMAPARLAIISANPDLLHRLKLNRINRKSVRNGPLECLFATFGTAGAEQPIDSAPVLHIADEDIAEPLRNRLRKNARHLQRWAARNDVSCYRIYDADLPEFSFALDRYQSEIAADVDWYHLQEYKAPASIDESKAEYRIKLAVGVVRQLFSIPENRLFCKTRSRQRGSSQYQKQDSKNEFYQVREGAASLLINLSDYLDSGLFLDHRITRERVNQQADGKSLLNLFCYTGTVGVQAGLGGARLVDNVDLSSTYLNWSRENHLLNGLTDEGQYRFIRADIVELLNTPERYALQPQYDLIFCDPPSFSNSSKMQQSFDIQRDHEVLIRQSVNLLAAEGLLLFSTNRRNFKLSDSIKNSYDVIDITRATITEDFKRNPKIHCCWEIRHRV